MMAIRFSLPQVYRWMRASWCSSMGRTGQSTSLPRPYPTCQPGVHAYAYTAVYAAPPPPPLGPVTPSAPYPGGPTPTPVPTPSSGPFPTALSADGLLAGGWPRINLERVQPEYMGVTYQSTGGGYINERGADTSIAPDVLEELEVLSITYRVDVKLPAPLTSGPFHFLKIV